MLVGGVHVHVAQLGPGAHGDHPGVRHARPQPKLRVHVGHEMPVEQGVGLLRAGLCGRLRGAGRGFGRGLRCDLRRRQTRLHRDEAAGRVEDVGLGVEGGGVLIAALVLGPAGVHIRLDLFARRQAVAGEQLGEIRVAAQNVQPDGRLAVAGRVEILQRLRVHLEVVRAVIRAGQAGEHLDRHVHAVGIVHLFEQVDALREQRLVVGLIHAVGDLPQVVDALRQLRFLV